MATLAHAPCDEGLARAPRAPEASHTARRGVLVATVLGSSLSFIDGAVVNVALPALQAAFGASAALVQWVMNAYLLLLGALVLLGGAAADRYGRRRVFVLGIVLFAFASLACALAPSATLLVAARALQGFAAALLTPASLALLGASFSEAERPRAFSIWAGAGGLATALAPLLGGWLVDTVGWRWIFLINLPLAAAAIIVARRTVPESRDERAQPLDWPGAVLAAASLGALTFGLSSAPERGWTALTWSCIGAGVLVFGAFLAIEQRSRAPMMPLGLYRERAFSVLNAMTFLLYFALTGGLFLLPFELIRVENYSATQAGAALIPFALIMGLFSSSAGKLASRLGNRAQLAIGPIVAGAGFAWLGMNAPGGGYWTTRLPALVVVAVGMTLTVGPLTAAVMSAVEQRHAGLASGINNAVARIAGLLAVALFTLIVAIVAAHGGAPTANVLAAADPAAFHRGFGVAMLVATACAATGGILVAVALRTSSPAQRERTY